MDEDEWWKDSWENAIRKRVNNVSKEVSLTFDYLSYDDYFKPTEKVGLLAEAPTLERGERISDLVNDDFSMKAILAEQVKWRAGMVIKFLKSKQLRDKLHDAFEKTVGEAKPDIVYTHSLGTLIAYSYFQNRGMNSHHPWVWVTSASQLANKYLKKLMPDPLQIPNVTAWYNLNNPKDGVFAEKDLLVQSIPNRIYESFPAKFEIVFLFNHDEPGYLNKSPEKFWQKLLGHF